VFDNINAGGVPEKPITSYLIDIFDFLKINKLTILLKKLSCQLLVNFSSAFYVTL